MHRQRTPLCFFTLVNIDSQVPNPLNPEIVTEDFLHYAWRYQHFQATQLQTTQGQSLAVLSVGELNRNAGPDFLNARLHIEDTLWAGNVEIHLKSSDWLLHHHQQDPAYNNVVLHVVLDEDVPIQHTNGERLPCLELRRLLDPDLCKAYYQMLNNALWIPCQNHWHQVKELTKKLWLERLMVERLETKSALIKRLLTQTQGDWEEVCYQLLLRNFGLTVNMDPCEQVARSLPLKLLSRHRDNLIQLEALLFGQAGLLETEFADAYPQQLQQEYRFQRQKYGLEPLPPGTWKFLRMRPANFPTMRLAQFAVLLYQGSNLFSKILAARDLEELTHLFAVTLHGYWSEHYTFDKPSPRKLKHLGSSFIELLVLNACIPLIFYHGLYTQSPRFCDQALRLMQELPPEANHIMDGWKKLGLEPEDASQTQALLHLKREYCDKRKCLHCAVGNAILK